MSTSGSSIVALCLSPFLLASCDLRDLLPKDSEKVSVQTLVSAAAGGTVTAGPAQLVIPPGAIARDVTVTVESRGKENYPASDQVSGLVLEFGPEKTTFSKPVTLSIDLAGASIPSGKVARLAWNSGDYWHVLADSAVVGGKVQATTTHFTAFTIMLVDGNQVGGVCGSGTFAGCGGDLKGKTFNFTAACAEIKDTDWGKCAGASLAVDLAFDGKVVFNADGTYSEANIQHFNGSGSYPRSCLGTGETCDSIKPDVSGTTVVQTATACNITVNGSRSTADSGTYSTAGGTLTLKSAGGDTTLIDYCLDDAAGMMTARMATSSGAILMFTASNH